MDSLEQKITDAIKHKVLPSQKRKILFLPKWYPNNFDHSEGNFIQEHAIAVGKREDLFVLFIHSDYRIQEDYEVKFETKNGFNELTIHFKSSPSSSIFNKIKTGSTYLKTQKLAYYTIEKIWGKPQLVHSHVLLRSSILAYQLKQKLKIPFLISEHSSVYDKEATFQLKGIKKWFYKRYLKQADGVTAVSNSLLNQIKAMNVKTNYYVVPNTVDASCFQLKENQSENDKVRLLHISTLSKNPKNFDKILRVIAKLWQENKNFEFHVAGGMEETEAMLDLAKELKIYPNPMVFHGVVDKKGVSELFQMCDLFVLFSQNETQSVVLIESFLSGVPAIIPNVGGAKELISEDNGYLVERNDETQLAELLCNFIQTKPQFNSSKIRQEAMRFDYKEVGKMFSEIYDELTNQTHSK